MTKITPEMEDSPPMDVSADVSFTYNRFPKYKLGPTNQILEEPPADSKGPHLSEVVGRETAFLSDQHKRLSVRDLATKFDSNLCSAVKLTEQAKINDKPSLEGHVLLKKLRDALESLRGRMVGKHKDDVEKAISMVEALAVKLTQKEGELIQEKFEVKKLAAFLRQASEDAKRLVNQERSFACAEIESARAVVQRFGEALEEEEKNGGNRVDNLNVDALVEEVQEARRIKLKHQPSKVMDMEYELRALKAQIREKSLFSVKLEKELSIQKREEERKTSLYVITGGETLGSCLQLHQQIKDASPLSLCLFQWFRVSFETDEKERISGADKSWYAPEPRDVGSLLQVEITSKGVKFVASTAGVIEDGTGHYIDTLLRKSSSEFNVTVSKINGQVNSSNSVHVFNVGKSRIKLCRGWITKAREIYSTGMQIYGVRGEGNVATAARSLVWQPKKGVSYTFLFESDRERNAAIIIARKYSLDCNVTLAGPDDRL